MDSSEYREKGKEMVDYIADYLERIRERRVFPDVEVGYMRDLVPEKAPEQPESWDLIFRDIERVIMPGMTHWQSPYMHAYFPALNSFPSLLADMLADALNCICFTWTTASESTYICMLAARTTALKRYQETHPTIEASDANSLLVAYCSDQAHSSVEKSALIALVKLRFIESDENLRMRSDVLLKTIKEDKEKGLIPFFVCGTLGTTQACAFDQLNQIGPICQQENIWLHVDAAYAGTAFVCPEFRHFLKGIEYADSFVFNPSKWMLVHFACTAMWVKEKKALLQTFAVDPIYLRHENSGFAVDYMHWQIGLSKKFRALKLWFVIRNFGISGLQAHVRSGVARAKEFELLTRADDRFEIPAARHLGLVVFRLKGEDHLTKELLDKMNSSGKLYCVPSTIKGKFVIRYTVTSTHTTLEDIRRDVRIIQQLSSEVLGTSPVDASSPLMSLEENKLIEFQRQSLSGKQRLSELTGENGRVVFNGDGLFRGLELVLKRGQAEAAGGSDGESTVSICSSVSDSSGGSSPVSELLSSQKSNTDLDVLSNNFVNLSTGNVVYSAYVDNSKWKEEKCLSWKEANNCKKDASIFYGPAALQLTKETPTEEVAAKLSDAMSIPPMISVEEKQSSCL